jgi:hypothetical protein
VSTPAPPVKAARGSTLTGAFAFFLLIDFIIVAVMLWTDKNLQTDFGAVSPYYLHWYGALAIGVITLLEALLLIAVSRRAMHKGTSGGFTRFAVMGALAWTVIVILASLVIVFTYSSVGFSTLSDFAHYLFGVTAYAGALSYIPWLYDLMLAMYVLTALVGAGALRRLRPATPPAS